MYKQIDGIAMGSPLVPKMANIFVVCFERVLLAHIKGSRFYISYVDILFCVFEDDFEFGIFIMQFTRRHFTGDKENTNVFFS